MRNFGIFTCIRSVERGVWPNTLKHYALGSLRPPHSRDPGSRFSKRIDRSLAGRGVGPSMNPQSKREQACRIANNGRTERLGGA